MKTFSPTKFALLPLLVAVLFGAAGCDQATAISANKDAATRHGLIGSDFPILRAVEVPATSTLVFLSGAVPGVSHPEAPQGTLAAYGDTETQTINVLHKIDDNLKSLGLTMGDVIKMQVFLVGDPGQDGNMDFAGFMRGYRQFFGTPEQPNLPSRSAFQVAGLANPNFLVEIEVTAVRP
ncbi:RidA family protein [Alteromonas gilva]|uniref:RidA family protein n=1 Tax=Alteromonas gilva TaxID=2987522 RepID=A0ABT5KYQ7_9ALTE|nr:RidA family protein [Alteromonas gilva]MDC8829908.1 RidA family protein [Alteromonas gilva]